MDIEGNALKGRSLLFAGVVFYGFIAVVSLIFAAVFPDWLGFKVFPESVLDWLLSLLAGLLSGLLLVAASWVLVRRTKSGQALAERLGGLVGKTAILDAILLAVIAGIAEELLFRGAMWSLFASLGGQWLAIAATSVLFAAVHGAFRRGTVLWGMFALFGGVVAGILLVCCGNLLAPIVMHVVTDAVNLPVLVRRGRPCGDQ